MFKKMIPTVTALLEVPNIGVHKKYYHHATCYRLLGNFISVYQLLRLFKVE